MYDLHAHSTASDGTLSPTELVRAATAGGIRTLALTDHDSVAGLKEAGAAAAEAGLCLIPGVELSVTWESRTIHVVGLNIVPDHPGLNQGMRRLQAVRFERAQEMDRRLTKKGIPGTLEIAVGLAGAGMVTRTHFARALVQLGQAATVRDVFDKFLTQGKPGHVPTVWAEMTAAVGWIIEAGGVAVLAHPQRYKMTGSWIGRLAGDFKAAGGEAIEVVSGNATSSDIQANAAIARRHGLLASVGSDYHGPEQSWLKLGRIPPLPAGLTPVWTRWEDGR
ncbi:PHP domain-containing protein [Methylococcus capsulatus]|uniref:PHP domain protein n=1 Tax=Methylococcus capsulatus (strain ATCC 33009 / NCIMB 11132 / Bath) TaxID=243233 RepID=Q60BV5_METCA|nr:PHP domain-containing protein [Methylococcus capsulatus]AAU90527.1 PHP domain protein [Methylococcus capsulatus str. Bath]QXP88815.1 PHP domain-containing protein [Methylococcus capsulatus]QXP94152.1 PHP domain-containing protein [Methylococcus capsulatus]UQN11106.1 PHP domain-containing protein [Methylococcus capsulatus]